MTDAQLIAIAAKLKDPTVVHAAMLRGEIAKPALRDMLHAYGGDVLAKWDAAQPVPDAALHTAVRLVLDATPEHLPMALDALRDHAGAAPVAQQAEPPADWFAGMPDEYRREAWRIRAAHPQQPARVPLTPREAELIDGMIARELDHAARCDGIANRLMGEKHKGWDMERVALLRKLAGIVPAPTTGGEG